MFCCRVMLACLVWMVCVVLLVPPASLVLLLVELGWVVNQALCWVRILPFCVCVCVCACARAWVCMRV